MAWVRERPEASPARAAAGTTPRSERARDRVARRSRLSRSLRGALAAVLALGALAGCAAAPTPILSDAQRRGIRVQLAGQEWNRADDLAGLAQPAVEPGPTVADHDWPAAVQACMVNAGYAVTVDGTSVGYLSGSGGSLQDFELSRFTCLARTPRLGAVAVYLTKGQLGAIYDYYTRYVVPCLQLAGAHTTTAPERSQFVDRFFAYEWHPYDAVWSTTPGDADVARLERECPPVPGWLQL